MRRFRLFLSLLVVLLFASSAFAGTFVVLPKRGSAWSSSGYSAETLAYQTRVEADGGVVVSLDDVESVISSAKSGGWYGYAKGIYSPQYGIKIIPFTPTGGTASASTEYNGSYTANLAVDANNSTRWASAAEALPQWLKYDFGEGNAVIIKEISILPYYSGGATVKDFVLSGSNNDSDYTTVYTGQCENDGVWKTSSFSNSTAYRYYKITVTSNWAGSGTSIDEIRFAYYKAESFQVSKLYDVTENDYDLTAGSAATYTPSQQNGRAALRFSSGNYYRCSSFSAGAQPNMIFGVAKQTSNPATPSAFLAEGASATRHILGYNGAYLAIYAGSAWRSSSDTTYNSLLLLSALYNGASSELWKNGSSILSEQDPGSHSFADLWVGIGNDAKSARWIGDIDELIILHSDATYRTSVESFLNTKWAVY